MCDEGGRGWVFMDAGDTFIYGYPTLYEAMKDCWIRAGSDIDIKRLEESVRGFIKTNPRGAYHSQPLFEKYMRAMYRNTLKELGFPGDPNEGEAYLWGEWLEGRRLRLFDDARPALAMLRSAGYRLGVISNWDLSFFPLAERLGAADWFGVTAISCREGAAKPDSKLFELALERAGAEASGSWHLGDCPVNDIRPAKTLGMRTILVDYFGKHGDAAGAEFHAPSLSVAAWMIVNGNGRDRLGEAV